VRKRGPRADTIQSCALSDLCTCLGVVAVKVHSVFFAAALTKRAVMMAGERGKHGNRDLHCGNLSEA